MIFSPHFIQIFFSIFFQIFFGVEKKKSTVSMQKKHIFRLAAFSERFEHSRTGKTVKTPCNVIKFRSILGHVWLFIELVEGSRMKILPRDLFFRKVQRSPHLPCHFEMFLIIFSQKSAIGLKNVHLCTRFRGFWFRS